MAIVPLRFLYVRYVVRVIGDLPSDDPVPMAKALVELLLGLEARRVGEMADGTLGIVPLPAIDVESPGPPRNPRPFDSVGGGRRGSDSFTAKTVSKGTTSVLQVFWRAIGV